MGITKDELTLRLDRVNGWINNCDQKSSILLAIEGLYLLFCVPLITLVLYTNN